MKRENYHRLKQGENKAESGLENQVDLFGKGKMRYL